MLQREGSTIMLETPTGALIMQSPAIDSIWVRNAHAGRGMIIGSMVSAILIGMPLSGLYTEAGGRSSSMAPMPMALGAIPGLVIGGIIGSRQAGWVRGYPR